MFTLTFLGKNPLTRQTRRTCNRSRANLNGPIRNTFIVFCWNQSQTILFQGSSELLISLLYMHRRTLGQDWVTPNLKKALRTGQDWVLPQVFFAHLCYVLTIPDGYCACTKTIPHRASVPHAYEQWFRRHFCNRTKLLRAEPATEGCHTTYSICDAPLSKVNKYEREQ